MSLRWPPVAAGATCAVVLLSMLLPVTAASAAAGTWAPTGSVYRNGVVCALPTRDAALVAWQTSAGDGPAFATRTITAPAAGRSGPVDTPATDPTTTTPLTVENSGRSSADLAALADLIATPGASTDANTVGAVAALVADDGPAQSCLAQGNPVDAGAATALAQQAAQHAGPYRVTVSDSDPKITLGTASTVTAQVMSAAGTAMSGLIVHFSADEPDAHLSSPDAVTDGGGKAGTTITVPSTSTASAVTVHATVSAPVGVVQLDAPGDVSLLQAAAPRTFRGQAQLPIDTTAAPVLHVQVSTGLTLPGATVHATVGVSGMRGHVGTATVRALGPLPFAKTTGCAGYRGHWPSNARASELAANVPVVADHGFPLSIGPIHDAGCYAVVAQVQTTNARPQATAQSSTDNADAVVAVAPLTLSAAPMGHGVAVPGPLSADVTVSGAVPATVAGTTGALLGPRLANKGACPTTGWSGAGSAGTVRAAAHADARGAGITSSAVRRDGCYVFRVSTTVQLPGIGSVSAPALTSAPVLVVQPQLAVTALSRPVVHPGDAVTASVAVYGTLTQPGTLRLQLARLPDTDGCFGRDYRSAAVSALPPTAPVVHTRGDGAYSVSSVKVPTDGCWTVEPVLALDNVPGSHVVGLPQPGDNVAFSSVPRPAEVDDGGPSVPVDPTPRRVVAAGLAGLLLLLALGAVWIVARREADEDPRGSGDLDAVDLAAGASSPG